MGKKVKRSKMGNAGKPVSHNTKRKEGVNLISRKYHILHDLKKVGVPE